MVTRDDGCLEGLTTAELDRRRSDLNVSAALAAPDSPVRVTVERELHRIAFALAARTSPGSP